MPPFLFDSYSACIPVLDILVILKILKSDNLLLTWYLFFFSFPKISGNKLHSNRCFFPVLHISKVIRKRLLDVNEKQLFT